MKKIVRLTESDLVRLVNKVIKEQMLSSKGLSLTSNMSQDSKSGCKKPSSSKELENVVKSKMSGSDVFFQFNVPSSVQSKLKGLKYGCFKYDKATNTLSLHDFAGYFKIAFLGDIYGDYLTKIKMPNGFTSKLPSDIFDEDMVPTWQLNGQNMELLVTGMC
jgi:hypothetical protein